MVVVAWFYLLLLVVTGFKLHKGGYKVARKPIVVDTRGFRAVWNGANMFESPPAWCPIMCEGLCKWFSAQFWVSSHGCCKLSPQWPLKPCGYPDAS